MSKFFQANTRRGGARKRYAFMSLVAAWLLAVAPRQVDAAELAETWASVRALGMGNAYTAVVDNSDSLFYNPAGLARSSGFNWTILDPRVGINGMDTIKNIQSIMGASDDYAAAIEEIYGDRIWAGGGSKTAILLPGIAIAGFGSGEAGIVANNPASPTLNLNYYFDYGVAVGTGFDLIPSMWHFGLVGRRINRTGTTLPIGPSTLATLDPATLESELKRRGTGYAVDVGSVISIPGPVSPAISIVYKNMGYTSFTHEEGAGAPPRIPPEIILGASLNISALIIDITPAIDFRYADRNDIQLGKKLHLGVEIDLPFFEIRGGFNQGYYTAGLGLDMGILRVDAATYGVELGEYPGQHEDRRYVAQITFELGFDPGKFGFGGGSGGSGKSGERRRLKQRR